MILALGLLTTAVLPVASAAGDLEASLVIEDEAIARGERTVFDATGSTSEADIVRYEWDWDADEGGGLYDTSTSDGRVEHSFSVSGEHTVQVRVEDGDGDTATARATVQVLDNTVPSPHFDWHPYDAGVNERIAFDASRSEDEDGSIVDYRWDFTQDGIFDVMSEDPVAHHAFEQGGSHEITLQVLDDEGALRELEREVDVDGDAHAPSVSLSVEPAEPTAGQRVTIDAIASQDPDGEIVAVRYDTDGDGASDYRTDGASSIRTSYASEGEYEVTVEAEDDEGRVGVASTTVTVTSSDEEPDGESPGGAGDTSKEASPSPEEGDAGTDSGGHLAAGEDAVSEGLADDGSEPGGGDAETSAEDAEEEAQAQAQQVPGPGLGLALLAAAVSATVSRMGSRRELAPLEPEDADEPGHDGDRD